MSLVTLTITDTDLENGAYSFDIDVANTSIDDGLATAGHITGLFLMTQIKNPSFRQAADTFAAQTLKANNIPLAGESDEKRVVTVTMEDTDFNAGHYTVALNLGAGDEEITVLTPAQLTGLFIKQQLHNPAFVSAVWDFAAELIRNNSAARIGNADQAPTSLAA